MVPQTFGMLLALHLIHWMILWWPGTPFIYRLWTEPTKMRRCVISTAIKT